MAKRLRFRTAMLGLIALFVLVVAAGPFAIAAGAASAATLTNTTVIPGGSSSVSGNGCVPRARVQVRVDGELLVAGRGTIAGGYEMSLAIPANLSVGEHSVTVVCAGPDGPVTKSATLVVALPKTGAFNVRDAEIAIGILTFGAALITFGIRRRPPARVLPARTSSPRRY